MRPPRIRRAVPGLAVAVTLARALATATALATPLARPLAAQARPGVVVQLPNASRLSVEGPLVRSRAMLMTEGARTLLESGFPARLRYRVELWTDGRWFDELQRVAEWEVIVRLRGVEQTFEVLQKVGDRVLSLGAFAKLADAEAAVARPVRVPISAPRQDRRYYYRVTLNVEALSVSDLEELNRWLRGELQPAVRGEANPGTALTRGIRSLTTRLLGGDRREYATRSPSFRPRR